MLLEIPFTLVNWHTY